ncbi:Transmembrane protease serine 9 [Liparis tanakae]|uniref:Transmembrane protease serine 9 n=1 Tax=Liparis tanakae TaxID=230148 RepID=A0A4Z2GM25_9TELE|nr:Transmembrane protease serine 9 [Liparis tanakae]
MADSNIAMLQLTKPVIYKDYIQPVCMDVSGARTFPIGSRCWVAGWEKGTGKAGSGLRDLESQVASCGDVSDSENICTTKMDLQQEDQGSPLLCSDHNSQCSDHNRKCSDHNRKCSGHNRKCSGHNRKCSGRNRKCSRPAVSNARKANPPTMPPTISLSSLELECS